MLVFSVVVVVGGFVTVGLASVVGVGGVGVVVRVGAAVGHCSHWAKKVWFSGEQTRNGTCASAHT